VPAALERLQGGSPIPSDRIPGAQVGVKVAKRVHDGGSGEMASLFLE
jgi:hypothetical protein